MYGVDLLGLTIPGQEFFVEGDVPFGIDAGCGFTWWPFDFLVLEAFIDKASVACDASGGVPAVDVSLLWVQGSENRYIDGWLTHSALVRMGPW